MLLNEWTLKNTVYADDNKKRGEKIRMSILFRSHDDLPKGFFLHDVLA